MWEKTPALNLGRRGCPKATISFQNCELTCYNGEKPYMKASDTINSLLKDDINSELKILDPWYSFFSDHLFTSDSKD